MDLINYFKEYFQKIQVSFFALQKYAGRIHQVCGLDLNNPTSGLHKKLLEDDKGFKTSVRFIKH